MPADLAAARETLFLAILEARAFVNEQFHVEMGAGSVG